MDMLTELEDIDCRKVMTMAIDNFQVETKWICLIRIAIIVTSSRRGDAT